MRTHSLPDQAGRHSLTKRESQPLELVSSRDFPQAPRVEVDYIEVFHQLIEDLPEQVALFDADTGEILAVNDAWEAAVTRSGYAGFAPGRDCYRELALISEAGNVAAGTVLEAVEEMRLGRRSSYRLVYDGSGQQIGQKFEVRVALLEVSGRRYIRITRYDLTELIHLRDIRDGYNMSLIQAQEDERRRMGRELHDSGLQLLASIGLSLARLKHHRNEAELTTVAKEMQDLLMEVQREFRSISFLAHPPQVDQLGLLEAVRALVEGFGGRAGLKTTFTSEGTVGDLSVEAAHSIYRVVQEGLSNVHRHAHAKKLAVRFVARGRSLHVVIADNGRGIPADIRQGVGLQGMRARMYELGGRLAIRNGSPGTVIVASVPIPVRERVAAD